MSERSTLVNISERKFFMGDSPTIYYSGYSSVLGLSEVLLDRFGHYSSMVLLVDSSVQRQSAPMVRALSKQTPVLEIVVDAEENHKNLALLEELLERAVSLGASRDSVVVAMGGGVVGNLAGMLAALLYRGLPLVHLPTTPVAAFDSVLSMKQAVNLQKGKNLCGAYLAPSLILCDLEWLTTVPREEMLTGLVEMAKNVLTVSPNSLDSFATSLPLLDTDPSRALRALLEIGIEAKAPFLQRDPRERRTALVFEYGHTLGHALEFASQGEMSHGEAVGWGMLAAANVAHETHGLPAYAVNHHWELLAPLGLSKRRLRSIDPGVVHELLLNDNKRGYLQQERSRVAMVLLQDLGRPVVKDDLPLTGVPRTLLRSALTALRKA